MILGGTATTYYISKKASLAGRVAKPAALPANSSATALQYEFSRADHGRQVVRVTADSSRQLQDSGAVELTNLQLNLYLPDGQHYDRIKSPKADFSQTDLKLVSNNEVEITLSVPIEGQPATQLTSIKTSGITFESKTGKRLHRPRNQLHLRERKRQLHRRHLRSLPPTSSTCSKTLSSICMVKAPSPR